MEVHYDKRLKANIRENIRQHTIIADAVETITRSILGMYVLRRADRARSSTSTAFLKLQKQKKRKLCLSDENPSWNWLIDTLVPKSSTFFSFLFFFWFSPLILATKWVHAYIRNAEWMSDIAALVVAACCFPAAMILGAITSVSRRTRRPKRATMAATTVVTRNNNINGLEKESEEEKKTRRGWRRRRSFKVKRRKG